MKKILYEFDEIWTKGARYIMLILPFVVFFIYDCVIFWLESKSCYSKKIFSAYLLIFLFLFFGPYLYSLSSITFFYHTNYIDIYTLFIALPLFFIYFVFTAYKKSSISFNDITLISFFSIFLSSILIFIFRDSFTDGGAGWLKLMASIFLIFIFILLSCINFIFQCIKINKKPNYKGK